MKNLLPLIILLLTIASVYGQKDFNLNLVAQVPHEIESNDIWGFVAEDGTEYAVIGTIEDCRIYDISDPENPELTATIPGATSVWRDFKTYKNYIYQITQRGTDGLTIIDMSEAPEMVTSKLYKGEIELNGQTTTLETCHNLYIDTIAGIAFLSGCNIGVGGILMLDIATDPLNPIYLGIVDERYSHDVVVKGDTLFASEINQGNLGIYDISDKANPIVLSRTQTTSNFTHNAWFSDDGNYVFTTDERQNSFVDSYDITDITNPIRLDKYQPKADAGIIPHNTHYFQGYLVTSWYTEGVIILDAHRPDNLVKVGQYDTYKDNATGFNGCWGAYPYLPSGLILASDLNSGLFIFEPDYQRAAYLEGEITDASSGSPINGATITINDCDLTADISLADGLYKTGTALTGTYEVTITHPDYETETITVELIQGEVTDLSIRLIRIGSLFSAGGLVVDESGAPIPEAQLIIESSRRKEMVSTDRNGFYKTVISTETYEIYVAAWGYKGRRIEVLIENPEIDDIVLEAGYEDDFFADLGWTSSGDALTGAWERVIPKGTFFNGDPANVNIDVDDDFNDYCYLTGNNNASVGADDVDDGTSILTSPIIDISDKKNPIIEINTWFFNAGGNGPINDTMIISLISEGRKVGVDTLSNIMVTAGQWSGPNQINVRSVFKRAKQIQLEISISDHPGSGHLVEGGIDKFRMYEGPLVDYPEPQEEIDVVIAPNPNNGFFYVDIFTNEEVKAFYIYDMQGRLVRQIERPMLEVELSSVIPSGVYLLDVLFDSGIRTRRKFQKL